MYEIVLALQNLKKVFSGSGSLATKMSFEGRQILLKRAFEFVNSNVEVKKKEFSRTILRKIESEHFQLDTNPIGLVSILDETEDGFEFSLSKVLPALLAGNVVLMAFQQQKFVDLFSKLIDFLKLEPALENDLKKIQIVKAEFGDSDQLNLLISHPAIAAVIVNAQRALFEKLKAVVGFFEKERSLFQLSHNTAFILESADLDLAVKSLVLSYSQTEGRSAFSIKSVFVVESRYEEFKLKLKASWKDIHLGPEGIEIAKILAKEGGKALGPNIIADLHHCSPVTQEFFAEPLLLIFSVKYPHEVGKWVNASSYGLLTCGFGDSEKVKNIFKKLEVEHLLINTCDPQSIFEEFGWPRGFKQSHLGAKDLTIQGTFFSRSQSVC